MLSQIKNLTMVVGLSGLVYLAMNLFLKGPDQDPVQDSTVRSVATIDVGDNIDEVQKLLDDHEIVHGRVVFSFAQGAEDVDYIAANIHPAHMYLCIWFSKTNRKVISMRVQISPWPKQGKAFETWLPVTSYQIGQDGTCGLTFPKPPTIQEVEQQRKRASENSQTPKFGG